jgi:hypothetical protein
LQQFTSAVGIKKKPMKRHLREILVGVLLAAVCSAGPAETANVAVELAVGEMVAPASSAIMCDGRLLIAAQFAVSHLGYAREDSYKAVTLKVFGHVLLLRDGAAICSYDGEELELDAPAVMIDGELYCPAKVLLRPFGAVVKKVAEGQFRIDAPGAHIRDIRQGSHNESVRVVIDLSEAAPFRCRLQAGAVVVLIPVGADEQGRRNLLRQLQFSEELVPTVTESHDKGWAQVHISHFSSEPPKVFTLGEPARIAIDLMRPEPLGKPQLVPTPERPSFPKQIEGVKWRSCSFGSERGPIQAWMLIVDPHDTDIIIRPALARDTIRKRQTVKRIAERECAYAAVNGGFFAPRGDPLGMLVIDGEWIATPLHQRAVLGFGGDGKAQIRNVSFDGWVKFERVGKLPVEGINRGHEGAHGIVVYTPRWGELLLGSRYKTRIVVRGGVVETVLQQGQATEVPVNGYVLSGVGQYANKLRDVEVGERVDLHNETNAPWPDLVHAVGGGPRLLKNGQMGMDVYDERFRSDVRGGARPRTAAGIDKDGNLILLVVDSINKGMTLTDLAMIMGKLGAVEAMNLDGGGSSTFVIAGREMNQPGDGVARSVSNAIVIIDRKSVAAAVKGK